MAERRDEVLAKLNEIQRLMDDIRELWPSPNIEAALRLAETYCRWALFSLGGSDRLQFEVGSSEARRERESRA